MPESRPTWVEDVQCWWSEAAPACAAMRWARLRQDAAVAAQREAVAAVDVAAAAARAGVAEAQADAARDTSRSLGWATLPVVGAVVVVAGAIGGYLWWRRQPTPTSGRLPLAQLSDDELERLIYERQFEAGVSGVTGASHAG